MRARVRQGFQSSSERSKLRYGMGCRGVANPMVLTVVLFEGHLLKSYLYRGRKWHIRGLVKFLPAVP